MKFSKYPVLILLVLNSLTGFSQQLKINSIIPSYLLQGDHLEFKVELSNISDSELTGQMQLELTDSMNHQSVDGWLMNTFPNQYFTIAAGKTEPVSFPIQIPAQFNRILKWRVSTRTGSNTDTSTHHKIYQEGILPVLTNRIERSETYSVVITDTSAHQLLIKKLSASGNNEAIENKLLQVEVSCNPSMFAVVWMPEIINQNQVSTHHLIESFFAACVLASLNEPTVLKVDKNKLNCDLTSLLSTIKKRQMKNGAFPWIEGGAEDLKSSIDFLTSVGQLKNLNAIPETIKNELDDVIDNALRYADAQVDKMITVHKFDIRKWSGYFYMRSYYPAIKHGTAVNNKKIVLNVVQQPKQWNNKTDLLRLIVYLLRSGEIADGKKLFSKINDQNYGALSSEQLSLLLDVYHEMHINNDKTTEVIKQILQQRKENGWLDASSTLSAYYSLQLIQSSSKSCEPLIHLQIGSIHLYNTKEVYDSPISYFRKGIDGSFIKPDMGSVSISVQNTQQLPYKKAYATLFWSYINESENVKGQNSIRISKTLSNKQGPINYPTVQLGDTIHVQLEISSDKDYDRVEVIDLSPAGLQPVVGSFAHQSFYNHRIYFYINQLKKGKNIIKYKTIAKYTGAYNFGITELLVPDSHIKIEVASQQNLTIE